MPVRDPGNLFQSGLIEFNPLVLVHDVAEHVGKRFPGPLIKYRGGSDPIYAGADSIESNLEGFDCFRRGRWRNLARIVLSVGQKHNGATL